MKRTALALGLLLAALPASPAAADSSSLFLYRETDIGGEHHLWRTPVDQVVATDAKPPIDIIALSPGSKHDGSLDLVAPGGGQLHVGAYNNARFFVESSTQPGMYVSRDGETDGSLEGSFTVRDIAFGADGQVKRLWATFAERCTCLWAYTFGEVRLGMPAPPTQVLPSALRWPAAYPGRGGAAVPFSVVANGGAVKLTAAGLSGPAAADFQITRDDCTGKTVPAGSTCEVWVRFNPRGGGNKEAFLDVRDSGGASHRASLAGGVAAGVTQLSMSSGPNNGVGAGRSYHYTPVNSGISVDGATGGLWMRVIGDLTQGDVWDVYFSVPAGQKLVPGRFPNAERDTAATSDRPEMSVSGQGRGCNLLRGEFTVDHSAFAPDGKLTEVGLSFVQYCDADTDPLVGRLDWHNGAGASVLDPPFPPPPFPVITGTPGQRRVRAPAACGRRKLPLLRGTRAADKLLGTAASDLLLGGRGNDRLAGGAGRDCLSGGTGRDRLRGGSGRDVLIGGPGRDRLDCGPGRDLAIASRRDVARRCERVR